MKRKGSQNVQFRQRIPQDILQKARGKTLSIPIGNEIVAKRLSEKADSVVISLKTANPSEAKTRHAEVVAYLESVWESLRNGPVTLTHKQAVALSGDVFKIFLSAFENDPGSPEMWEHVIALNNEAVEGKYGQHPITIPTLQTAIDSLEKQFGGFVDVILSKRSLEIDQESRVKVLKQTAQALTDAAKQAKRFAQGNYSDIDGPLKRFPDWEDAVPHKTLAGPTISMKQLVEDWWAEAKLSGRSESTMEGYKRTINQFVTFLGHNDATKVTPQDVLDFKDHRLTTVSPKTGRPASPKTVKDCDLAALKSIFGWALNNRKIKTNPAHGITVAVPKKKKVREQYFKKEEREAILKAAMNYKHGKAEAHKTAMGKRWIPWICAYTGARVGEIAQLRKEDIQYDEGFWTYRITPEAGTVKDGNFRAIPIHEHLIEQGFLDYVNQSTGEYLFLNIKRGQSIKGKRQALKNRVREFVRRHFKDKNLQPNHGWRHTFKTIAREIDNYDPKVIDDITGHAASNEGDKYGESTVKAKARLIRQYPRYF